MSANCDQRKQELLIRLAESRIEMLDGAEKITSRVEDSLDWLGTIRSGISRNPVLWIGGAAVAGLLAVKVAGGLLFSRHQHATPATVGSSRGFLSVFLSGIFKLLVMAALPSLKTVAENLFRNRISSWMEKR